jgi:hypothetical protein
VDKAKVNQNKDSKCHFFDIGLAYQYLTHSTALTTDCGAADLGRRAPYTFQK